MITAVLEDGIDYLDSFITGQSMGYKSGQFICSQQAQSLILTYNFGLSILRS